MGEAERILSPTPAEAEGPNPLSPAITADDEKWLTLCVYQEARGEIPDGRAAVAKVVLNRTRHAPPYCSDGSIKSTVFWPNQFSWTGWAMLSGHYVKVARTPAEIAARADRLYAQSIADAATWKACEAAALGVLDGSWAGGASYRQLGPDALQYVNLAVSRPAWADPAKLICQIGRHSFFRS